MNEVVTKEQLSIALEQADIIIVSGALALQLRVLANKEVAPLALPAPEQVHRMPLSEAANYAQKAGLNVRSAFNLVRYIGVANVFQVLRHYTVTLRRADGTELLLRRK
ncbi:MAG TPA: hypothetical protein VIR26_08670 [Metalysinibacillus sp.]